MRKLGRIVRTMASDDPDGLSARVASFCRQTIETRHTWSFSGWGFKGQYVRERIEIMNELSNDADPKKEAE